MITLVIQTDVSTCIENANSYFDLDSFKSFLGSVLGTDSTQYDDETIKHRIILGHMLLRVKYMKGVGGLPLCKSFDLDFPRTSLTATTFNLTDYQTEVNVTGVPLEVVRASMWASVITLLHPSIVENMQNVDSVTSVEVGSLFKLNMDKDKAESVKNIDYLKLAETSIARLLEPFIKGINPSSGFSPVYRNYK